MKVWKQISLSLSLDSLCNKCEVNVALSFGRSNDPIKCLSQIGCAGRWYLPLEVGNETKMTENL